MATLDDVRAVKSKAHSVFSSLADVVGVGITRAGDSYALKVNLTSLPADSVHLPDAVDGVPVRIEIVGAIRKQGESQSAP